MHQYQNRKELSGPKPHSAQPVSVIGDKRMSAKPTYEELAADNRKLEKNCGSEKEEKKK